METVGSTVMSLRHPEVRRQILDALEAIADRDYQQRVWIKRRLPHDNFHDDLSTNIHILFDDTQVVSHADKQVGFSIYPEEIALLEDVGLRLGSLIDDLGDAEDSAYLAHPAWPEVVAAAGRAAQVIRNRDVSGDVP